MRYHTGAGARRGPMRAESATARRVQALLRPERSEGSPFPRSGSRHHPFRKATAPHRATSPAPRSAPRPASARTPRCLARGRRRRVKCVNTAAPNRDRGHPPGRPPPQIRTCAIRASGSSVMGWLREPPCVRSAASVEGTDRAGGESGPMAWGSTGNGDSATVARCGSPGHESARAADRFR